MIVIIFKNVSTYYKTISPNKRLVSIAENKHFQLQLNEKTMLAVYLKQSVDHDLETIVYSVRKPSKLFFQFGLSYQFLHYNQ